MSVKSMDLAQIVKYVIIGLFKPFSSDYGMRLSKDYLTYIAIYMILKRKELLCAYAKRLSGNFIAPSIKW